MQAINELGSAGNTADPIIAHRHARARQRSVMIGTPIARNPVWQYTHSLASTLMFLNEQGIRAGFQFVVGGSVVHKSRNELCAHFLMSDFTDLLFIDDDMQWSPTSVLRLLASDKALIGGVGRMRVKKPNSDPKVWCWRPKTPILQDEMGAVEVNGFGGAFMLINRRVFADMVEAHPEWKREGAGDWPADLRAHYFEFFKHDFDDGREGSEDYVFCDRWQRLGNSVWVDPTVRLGHVGAWNFEGCVEELLTPDPEVALFPTPFPNEQGDR
jgi:hypothetical protein